MTKVCVRDSRPVGGSGAWPAVPTTISSPSADDAPAQNRIHVPTALPPLRTFARDGQLKNLSELKQPVRSAGCGSPGQTIVPVGKAAMRGSR